MNAKVLTIFILQICGDVVGRRLKWKPNTNLDNEKNYESSGAALCRNDHLVFPAKAPSVYLQANQTLMEIVLPSDGEIVLAEGSSLTFPVAQDSSCPGKTIRFNGASAKSWYYPKHWCVTGDSSDECLTSQPDLLDMERIPCESDDVIFPSRSGFYVDIDSGVQIRLGSLKLGDKEMNTESFRSYLDSKEGRKTFISQNASTATPTRFVIGTPRCSDVTGCICGTVRESLQSRVCAIQSVNCSSVTCRSSFQPEGHCCHICGAMFTIDYGAGFKVRSLRKLITDTFQKRNVGQNDTKVIVSKLDTHHIQAVLLSTADHEAVAGVARSVREELNRDQRYGALSVTLVYSEGHSAEPHTGEAEFSSGVVVGIIFAIIILVTLVLVTFYCYRNRDRISFRPKFPSIALPNPPDIRRVFRSESSPDDNLELHQQPVVFDNSRIFEGSIGFENPTYGDFFSYLRSDSSSEQPASESEKRGFQNPLHDSSKSPESKEPFPPDYVVYDVPPKQAPPSSAKRQEEKMEERPSKTEVTKSDSRASEEPKKDTLSRMLQAPFRLVSSKLKGPKLEEDAADAEDIPQKEDYLGPPVEAETEKRSTRSRFGKAKDHQKLEEADVVVEEKVEGETVEKRPRKTREGRKEEGFGNPLYSAEELGVVDKDLGEPGPVRYVAEPRSESGERTRTARRDKSGFENPVFDDSKLGVQKPEQTGSPFQKISGAVDNDDDSTV